jgi:cytidine deaminase
MSATNVVRVQPTIEMVAADRELLAIAQDLLARVWTDNRHQVATALRTPDGLIHTGVHVEGSCRRSSICAEGVALGVARAALAPEAPLVVDAVVSVQIKPAGRFRIIAPCGVCRELISDYSPDARVWFTGETGIMWTRAMELLPYKTRRIW